MALIHVESERTIDASPEAIYAVLADYQRTHRDILPPEHYLDYGVDAGGEGAGTTFHYRLRAGGRERPYTLAVSEPAQGRVLSERDTRSSLITTWTLTPLGNGQRTRVQIATEWQGGGGIGGFFERTFAPGGLRRIYAATLDRLAQTTASGRAPMASGAR